MRPSSSDPVVRYGVAKASRVRKEGVEALVKSGEEMKLSQAQHPSFGSTQQIAIAHEKSFNVKFIMSFCAGISTYDHRSVRTGHPVRSAIHKH